MTSIQFSPHKTTLILSVDPRDKTYNLFDLTASRHYFNMTIDEVYALVPTIDPNVDPRFIQHAIDTGLSLEMKFI